MSVYVGFVVDSVALKGASFQVFRSPCHLSPIIIVLVTQNIMILIILNVGFLHDHGGLNAEGLKAITDLFLQPEKPVGIHSFPFCCWRKYMVYMTAVINTLLNNQEF